MSKRLFLYFAATMIILSCLCSCTPKNTKNFTDAGYTINLPDTASQSVFSNYTEYTIDKSTLRVSRTIPFKAEYSKTQHINEIYDECWNNGFEAILKQKDNITYIEYLDELKHPTAFYLIVPLQSKNEYWKFEFTCDISLREEYTEKFIEWAKRVKIK